MPWDLSISKVLSVRNLSIALGAGKTNTADIQNQFEENGSKLHEPSNTATAYCLSRGGWLPSNEEAEKVVAYTERCF